ncbi:hypothetical protein A374_05171 [Fictibacillus macauensis ZFHKF-1]|uniref:IDEAL domain-containing protein n=1 Tax=Fictibacillus macauensis ZFHKF-1 TaxID=1196324 RepID=I8UHM7_9BACL|nr:IDEAL domain-containing protein [Fictibacillus macauensis]EIT86328.1 hypothetical protein A374_05171 [Fictibacillus macauensis ZFHKF-1]
MKDNTSYNQNMNEHKHGKAQKKNDPFAFEIVAQLILDESLHHFQIKRYKQQIDEALMNKDEEAFHKLTTEYLKLLD